MFSEDELKGSLVVSITTMPATAYDSLDDYESSIMFLTITDPDVYMDSGAVLCVVNNTTAKSGECFSFLYAFTMNVPDYTLYSPEALFQESLVYRPETYRGISLEMMINFQNMMKKIVRYSTLFNRKDHRKTYLKNTFLVPKDYEKW